MSLRSELKNSVWCISENAFKAVLDQNQSLEAVINEPEKVANANVINLKGVISYDPSEFEQVYYEACSIVEINKALLSAEDDPEITHHVLNINSPGGSVTGTPELYELIQSLTKPVVAYCGSVCASGALWIASACDYFACSPSSSVGNVGAYREFYDDSGYLDKMGIKHFILQSGVDKTALWGETRPEALAFYQKEVENIHNEFKNAILSMRNVDVKHLEGLVYNGRDAVKIGFCDALVNTFEQFMKELT